MELGLTLGLVPAETSVDLPGVGGLEHAEDGVEHEDEGMDLLLAELEALEGLVPREVGHLSDPAGVLPVMSADPEAQAFKELEDRLSV